MITSQSVGLAGTIVLLAVSAETLPAAPSLAWAAAAGVSGVAGLGFFYYALSRGTMGVVAPLAALIGAGLPVLVAIAGGEVVSALRLLGIAVALTAVVLISLPGREQAIAERRRVHLDLGELPLVVLSGLGFAGFFVFMDRATLHGETWWPLVVVRAVGLSIVAIGVGLAVARRRGVSLRERAGSVLRLDRLRTSHVSVLGLGALFVITGLGDLGGNAFFILAKHADAFSVAVVLSSLYPIVTTILAAVFLRERLRPVQMLGVALATGSVPLLR
jgi:drug/metabolite transporter (DMT)-like permease